MNQVIATENAEWVTVRDAMRTLNGLVDELEGGDGREKVVLTKGGKMRAVVLSIDAYAALAGLREPTGDEDVCLCRKAGQSTEDCPWKCAPPGRTDAPVQAQPEPFETESMLRGGFAG